MTVHAKEIINGKFWILEDGGVKIATLSASDDKLILSDKKGTRWYDNQHLVETVFNNQIVWDNLTINQSHVKEIYGYPTSGTPHNIIYDVKKKLPLFTKSNKSKSLYCAGYYIIKFGKGWVKSFCPKVITLERYSFKGPFKSKLEMKQHLSSVNHGN